MYFGALCISTAESALGWNKTWDGKEWTKHDLETEYAQKSHFNGKYMSISVKGQNQLKKVLMGQVHSSKVDRLPHVMGSNLCKTYFNVLPKFMQGKLLNFDWADSWKVLQLFVMGLQANCEF